MPLEVDLLIMEPIMIVSLQTMKVVMVECLEKNTLRVVFYPIINPVLDFLYKKSKGRI